MGGTSSLEGRVEICQNNMYSTVCDDFWDELEAKVVCAQLEYTGESELSPTIMNIFCLTNKCINGMYYTCLISAYMNDINFMLLFDRCCSTERWIFFKCQ